MACEAEMQVKASSRQGGRINLDLCEADELVE